ncbi:MAG: hypothetical protein J7497_14380, partial [Chitinophagaceae bacterium]|nr:hypothetical protein [Chitinophagaceae bacterium]
MNVIANCLAIPGVGMFSFYKNRIQTTIFLLLLLIVLGKEGMTQGGEVLAASARDRIIQPDVRSNWELLQEEGSSISPDGKYAAWVIVNPKSGSTLVISAIDGTWRRELNNQETGFFARSGRHYISTMFGKWCIVPLGVGEPQYLEELEQMKCDKAGRWVIGQKKNGGGVVVKDLLKGSSLELEAMDEFSLDKTENWLLGKRRGDAQSLILYHLPTGKILSYTAVQNYELAGNGRSLLVQLKTDKGGKLLHISLPEGKQSIVYLANGESELVNGYMDNAGKAIGFTLRDKIVDGTAKETYSYWYYRLGDAQARCLVNDSSLGIPADARLTSRGSRFTRDGRHLIFGLQPTLASNEQMKDAVQVDVWGYQDDLIYPNQTADYNPAEFFYTAVASVEGGRVTTFVQERMENLFVDPEHIGGDYAVVTKNMMGDRFWEYKRDSVWLLSLLDGSRKLLPFIQVGDPGILEIDKDGTSVIAFDTYRGRHFYRYEIATGREIKLSANVPDWILGVENLFFVGWQQTEKEKEINPVIAARTEKGNEWLVY